MPLVSRLVGFCLSTLVFALAGTVGLSATPAAGQILNQDDPSEAHVQPSQKGPTHSPSLPDWAEPSTSNRTNSASTEGGATALEGEFRTHAPPPPGEEPVPVNGGLALLAAAGAGYAVRKLREDAEEDDEEPA